MNTSPARKVPKRLKVVEVDRPWTALARDLTGDTRRDERTILDFCAKRGVSKATVAAKLKLYSEDKSR